MSHEELTSSLAEVLARQALECVQREYPNKISHVLNADRDVLPPRVLTPAFYGCYDWHSAVHNHWLLARLARLYPGARFAHDAHEALQKSLIAENVRGEVAYLSGEGRQSFERPYGLAWLLQLAQELSEWDHSVARELAANLLPLEQAAVERLHRWLAKLEYPVRTGEHNQTAFSLGLMIDYARHKKDSLFFDLVAERARKFYFNDKKWPFEYEPSGEDFLSPGLAEADLMRRVLSAPDRTAWLSDFLPGDLSGLRPMVSPDPSDPKFSHLDGLNLSRAWMLEGIAWALSEGDAPTKMFHRLSETHKKAGLAALSGKHYVGSHWLGSFAAYLLTRRGISGSCEDYNRGFPTGFRGAGS